MNVNVPFSIQAATHLPLPDLRDRLLQFISEVAYQEGNFQLSSGQSSPYYINGKQVTLHPAGAVAIARLLLPLLPEETVAVAGLTLGADPLVTATSVVAAYHDRALNALIVRKEAKGHGTQAYLEGPVLPPNSAVVVLEDVVTTGQSALKAVDRLQAAGYQVTRIIAIVDRQQGGAERYQQLGLTFQALFTIAAVQRCWRALSH
ncbi:orotate phosphoribosyltransferase [Trichothermofontia sp.]